MTTNGEKDSWYVTVTWLPTEVYNGVRQHCPDCFPNDLTDSGGANSQWKSIVTWRLTLQQCHSSLGKRVQRGRRKSRFKKKNKKSQANRQQEQISPLFSCQSRWSASPRARRYRRRWIDTGANASRFIPSCKVSIKSDRLAFAARVRQGILTRGQWKKPTFSSVCVTRASLRPWLAERARTTVLKKERKERKNRIRPYWFCWTS